MCAKFIYSCINFEIRSPNSLVDRIDRIRKFFFFFIFCHVALRKGMFFAWRIDEANIWRWKKFFCYFSFTDFYLLHYRQLAGMHSHQQIYLNNDFFEEKSIFFIRRILWTWFHKLKKIFFKANFLVSYN